MIIQFTVEEFVSHLEANGKLTAEGALRVQGAYRASRQPVDVILRELGLMQDAMITEELARYLSLDCHERPIDFSGNTLIERLGASYARENAMVPLEMDEDQIWLLAADPFDRSTIEAVGYFFDRDVQLTLARRSWIEEQMSAHARASAIESSASVSSQNADNTDMERLVDIAREAPVVKFVSRIIQQAVDQRATDIHVEPQAETMRVRFRRDGLLMATETVASNLHAGVISRLKILARLNIAERRLPQDGKIRIPIRGQEVDLRLSVMPTVHGETAVLRILDRQAVSLDLSTLGYSDDAVEGLLRAAARPNGLMLVTGPTGSGKTTTLYALLNALNRPEVKIFTVEDPVEYRFHGITQLQVDPTIGLTFASALRSVLRQDPDIILVGEIRDRETAEIAVQAALTGHLVLSTLHTNSAVGAFSRLRDMGVEPFLLEATTRCVIGQRLVRRFCQHCSPDRNQSCENCGGTRFSGRRAAYEILHVSNSIGAAIVQGKSEADLLDIACGEGMVPLRQHAEGLVKDGETSMSEIIRVIEAERW
ncbi:GspE/PulE family protein [Ensifer sp. ENS12]|uniref:GspE/PulE family protein n=1 Tax=Ensifer sp. ENS12 TaxID=2854774 RepID=UPI001C44A865|nr:GspE/PulE family protein [Ensifer sp. ENS12]MBV7518875.1 GspE/PulE family protein [Ensifer sp. ENS12]